MFVFGGLGIAADAYSVLAAGALAVCFLVSTPTVHDFWNAPDDRRRNEQIHVLKTVALFGTSPVSLALGATAWPYAVGVGPFRRRHITERLDELRGPNAFFRNRRTRIRLNP